MNIPILCAAVLLAATDIWLYMRVRNRLPKQRRAGFCAAAVLVLLMLLGAAYFADDYRAGPGAAAALRSDDAVTVERLEHAWRFDGPGGDAALIFYPGAKVEAAAYAPLLHTLAAGGTDAFLLEMPLQFALLDISAAERIMGRYDYGRFVLAGHSLGGVAAAAFAGHQPDRVSDLVFLASYPAAPLPAGLRVLSIYGDKDTVLNREKYAESRVYFPAETEEIVLAGGNHAHFGDYGPQRGDGEALIPADEQQRATAGAILRWIEKTKTGP